MNTERDIELPGENEEWIREVSSDDERQIEIEDFKFFIPQEVLDKINFQAHKEALEEAIASDPVVQKCKYHRFISRSNGRYRNQRRPRLVELLEYCGQHYALNGDCAYGAFDKMATEIYGESVDSVLARETLLNNIRKLRKVK